MSKYNVGDRIKVTLEVTAVNATDYTTVIVGYRGAMVTPVTGDELDAGKLMPPPLKAGDKVVRTISRPGPGGQTVIVEGAVVAVDGDTVWMRNNAGGNVIVASAELVRAA